MIKSNAAATLYVYVCVYFKYLETRCALEVNKMAHSCRKYMEVDPSGSKRGGRKLNK